MLYVRFDRHNCIKEMVCAVENMILIRFNLPIAAYEISVLSARYNKNKEIWVHEILILVVEHFISVCKIWCGSKIKCKFPL